MHGEALKEHIQKLKDEAKKNESMAVNKEKMSVKELVDLWKYQGQVQQTLMWLQNIEINLNPPLIKPVGNGGLIVAQ